MLFTMNDIAEKFGVPEHDWLGLKLREFYMNSGEFEYADNHRLTLKDDPEYDRAREEGCCGSCDLEFGPSPVTGNVYWYGFNYGH